MWHIAVFVMLALLVLYWLLCEFCPNFMVGVMSNPYTSQARWCVGRDSFRFQTVNLVLYHAHNIDRVAHIITFHVESVAWLLILHRATHIAVMPVAVLILCAMMADGTRCVRMAFVAFVYWSAAATAAVLCPYSATVAAFSIVCGATIRCLAHTCDGLPPGIMYEGGFDKTFSIAKELLSDCFHPPRLVSRLSWTLLCTFFGVWAEMWAAVPFRATNPGLYIEMIVLFPSMNTCTSEEGELETIQYYLQQAAIIEQDGFIASVCSRAAFEGVEYNGYEGDSWTPSLPKWLPNPWYWLFLAELPICFVTVLMWMVDPDTFLQGVYGIEAPTPAERALLNLPANVVFSAYVWFYGRLLLQGNDPDMKCLKMLQEGMLIGDIWVVAASIRTAFDDQIVPGNMTMFYSQIVTAGAFGLARVVFLYKHRVVKPVETKDGEEMDEDLHHLIDMDKMSGISTSKVVIA